MIELLQELERRNELIKCIDAIIINDYLYTPKKRLKRGYIQQSIISKLELTRTNLLCIIINERMQHAGYETITNSGTKYYRHKDYKYCPVNRRISKAASEVLEEHQELFRKLSD